jgi:hypothetical protein
VNDKRSPVFLVERLPYDKRSCRLTRQVAQYVISSLERAGIIVPAAGESRPALYVANEVLSVLQRDD